MALEKIDGISAAYINKDIVLHYTDNAEFDQKALEKVLSKYKMKVKEASDEKGNPFG